MVKFHDSKICMTDVSNCVSNAIICSHYLLGLWIAKMAGKV